MSFHQRTLPLHIHVPFERRHTTLQRSGSSRTLRLPQVRRQAGLKACTTSLHFLFPPVMASCTTTPISPRTTHAIGAHFSPGVDCGYKIQTSVGDESRVIPLVDTRFINPTIIVHAPPNAVPTTIT